MNRYLSSVTAACLAAGSAHAGALDRTGQSVDVLFETGRYGEFSFAHVSPDVSGRDLTFASTGGSGDIAKNYSQFGAAYKADWDDRFSYAFIFEQPFTADTDYPDETGYFAQGSTAEFNSYSLTGLLQYNIPTSGFSVFGGVRVQRVDANVSIQVDQSKTLVDPGPRIGVLDLDYSADADHDWGVGYVVGAAYERPDIALRVSLTYNSKVTHSVDTEEVSFGRIFAPEPGQFVPLDGDLNSKTDFDTPQSINLALQTGVAPGTLVFGGVRWVDWSDFDLSPSLYSNGPIGAPLLSYEDDVFTYTLGVGRRLTDSWSVAATLGYEKSTGNYFTNLGPTDGQKSIGLAAIYTKNKMKITAGVRYISIGDTETKLGDIKPLASFEDNDAIAFGVKVGYYF